MKDPTPTQKAIEIENHPSFGKIEVENGRIAYHSYRFAEDGGLDFVQYDFNGKVEYVERVRHPAEVVMLNP